MAGVPGVPTTPGNPPTAGALAQAGAPGPATGGAGPAVGGAPATAGAAGTATPPAAGGGSTAPTPPGNWAPADPAMTGPFATTTEENVGPDGMFTMYRPMELTQRHPVITWGNGTGTTPPTYRGGLNLYASHGFIVIASNSMNVGQGDPPPMLNGVTWVLEQDMTQGSALFGHVDREHIGATGHSQGAFATTRAGTDERIKTIAPIQSFGGARGGLHGPVLALCGTGDTVVPCSGNLRGYESLNDQPIMYAELKSADHTNWIASRGGMNPYWLITNAWFRVHLMGDTALRPMFYGECSLCQDTATWVTMRKMMD
ncbi:MAG: hypothetical protein ABW321_28315 [Polyangiales bacterium]